MILVSACLAGFNCRYDGTSRSNDKIVDLVRQGKALPVCPEQLGGLETPRDPAEQLGEYVVTKIGEDVTASFQKGAEEGLRLALMYCCSTAILKSNSPSCGSEQVYDGTFSKKIIPGDGVFAKLLKSKNIEVYTEKNMPR